LVSWTVLPNHRPLGPPVDTSQNGLLGTVLTPRVPGGHLSLAATWRCEPASSRAHQFGVLLERGQPHPLSPLVDLGGVLDGAGLQDAVHNMELGAVALALSFVHEHAIGEVGDIFRTNLFALVVRLHQGQALALKGHVVIGMLYEELGRPGAVTPNHVLRRPTMLRHDQLHSVGILTVDFLQTLGRRVVIALRAITVLCSRSGRPHDLILVSHPQELHPQLRMSDVG